MLFGINWLKVFVEKGVLVGHLSCDRFELVKQLLQILVSSEITKFLVDIEHIVVIGYC